MPMKIYHFPLRGITLLELLVSLAILGILISIGVGSYHRLFAQQDLIQKSEKLYHFLRLANSHAINKNKVIYAHFCPLSNSGAWKVMMSEVNTCDCLDMSTCLLDGLQVSEQISDGNRVSISAADINFSSKQASYGPMRFDVNTGSVKFLDNSGAALKIIQSTMRLRICSPEQAVLGYQKC